MITRKYFDDLITHYGIPHDLTFTAATNMPEKFKALGFYHLKERLTDEEINYYCDNYEQIEDLVVIGSLSLHRLAQYIHFFYEKKVDLNTVIFNKKVVISAEICRQKIINTLKYDFDSFEIRIGNIRPRCVKIVDGTYKVFKYVGEGHKLESASFEGYQELYTLSVPNLKLLEVTW